MMKDSVDRGKYIPWYKYMVSRIFQISWETPDLF
jgi:hypothetical protein